MNCCFSSDMIADFFRAGNNTFYKKNNAGFFLRRPGHFVDFFHSSETHQHARKLSINNETSVHRFYIFISMWLKVLLFN